MLENPLCTFIFFLNIIGCCIYSRFIRGDPENIPGHYVAFIKLPILWIQGYSCVGVDPFSWNMFFQTLMCWTFPPHSAWRKLRPEFSALDQRTGVSTEIACLESSHHSTVIETESPDLYGSYFRKKEWLKGSKRSMKTKWVDRMQPRMHY